MELSLQSQTFELTLTPNDDGEDCRIIVQATLKSHHATNGNASSPSSDADSTNQPVQRKADALPNSELVTRKRRTPNEDGDDEAGNDARKRLCIDREEDMTPQINQQHVEDLLASLRADVRNNTSESVNHVQNLLQQLRKDSPSEQSDNPAGEPIRESNERSIAPVTPGASSIADQDDSKSSIPEIVQRQTKLLSSQIKWVEECRRVAADIHDKREDTWRTTSAAFHEQQRQNRENFQNRILQESSMQKQTLNQILNEVKAIGLYAQSMKWETPSSHLAYPPPNYPPQPTYPTSRPPASANGASSKQPYRQVQPK